MKPCKVIGPRVLVKVKKFKKEDVEKIEGSIFYRPDADSKAADMQTVNQCTGEIVLVGHTAFKRTDAYCDGSEVVKIGDKVHFARHGALQMRSLDTEEHEYWLMMDKDIVLIEEA